MVNQKVFDYIRTSFAQGKSKEEIYQELLTQGWSIEVIQKNFNLLESEEESEDTHQRTVRIVVTSGAILIGAGIFSFIAANWQEMAKSLKVSIIFVSMLASYTSGWYLKENLNLARTGEALIFLGSIIYGAGIFLVAQMFNIRANWPDGFILWMLGTIVMALARESFLLFYLAIPLGGIALIGYPFGILRAFGGGDPFLLTSSFLLLVASVSVFITGMAVRKKIPPEIKEFY
jgi:uncharacterized membrane protein